LRNFTFCVSAIVKRYPERKQCCLKTLYDETRCFQQVHHTAYMH